MENLNNTNTQIQNNNHYSVDSNINIADHNAERAEFFKVDETKIVELLNGKSLEEKDKTILELMQKIQLLEEDNEVVRTVAMKERCQNEVLRRKLNKVSNNG